MTIPHASLKRRTTYREFTAQFVFDEDGSIPAQLLNRIEQREAEIAGKMLPGDELWEFENGNQAFAMS